ncbi:hypothetical protein [Bacterioplanoides sp.]|uniref:hypothetical protein n=1 Tax=Bacterioplanoides sp. TaxID=2066072 RepID=UPI003AFFAB5B
MSLWRSISDGASDLWDSAQGQAIGAWETMTEFQMTPKAQAEETVAAIPNARPASDVGDNRVVAQSVKAQGMDGIDWQIVGVGVGVLGLVIAVLK